MASELLLLPALFVLPRACPDGGVRKPLVSVLHPQGMPSSGAVSRPDEIQHQIPWVENTACGIAPRSNHATSRTSPF
ncbi:hypothetical protein BJF84_04770 [Rhodococcus sp. CUA-806]|nr:hypothetical protein BJF84_04770 [Rhodococcus sp. CUA-806]